jgi:ATP-dependent helicase/nuclease subunit A
VNGTQGLVWAGSKATDPAAVAKAREDIVIASENEYRRLLYVAMTRAQERLIVCGVARKATKDDDAPKPDGCWYQLIEDALVKTETGEAQSFEIDAEDADGKIWRYLKSELAAPNPHEGNAASIDATLPDWLTHVAPVEPARVVPLSPSDAGDDDGRGAATPAGVARRKAIQRGKLTHRLMQSLPGISPERRAETARAYLLRIPRDDFTEAELDDIAAQVVAILDDPRFTPLFAPGSRAEVPIAGRIARQNRAPLPVSGQVDRLIVTPEAVLIADYKTNHTPPRTLDEALIAYPNYALQLALYRALLGAIYPGRAVRAAIVWTETPALMEIPGHALDAALLPLTSM